MDTVVYVFVYEQTGVLVRDRHNRVVEYTNGYDGALHLADKISEVKGTPVRVVDKEWLLERARELAA